MIPFNELKVGAYVIGEFEGQQWQGEVTRLNNDEKQVCVNTDVQDFWFQPQHLHPIPINDETLRSLNFTREDSQDGFVKYKKGSFRILLCNKEDFSNFEMWYREDKRHHPNLQYIHQLQNDYLQMTKVHLTKQLMA